MVVKGHILILVAVAVAAIAGAAMLLGGGSSPKPHTAPATTGGATAGAVTSTAAQATVSRATGLEGSWSGSYTSSHGGGEWQWVLRETGKGVYIGCMRTSGAYRTNGWIPVRVEAMDGKIEVAPVGGGPPLVIEARVMGASLEGRWSLTGAGSGTITGRRVSSDTTLPCTESVEEPAEPHSAPAEEASADTASSTVSGAGSAGEPPVCGEAPPRGYRAAYAAAYGAAAEVFGAGSIGCLHTGMLGGMQYYASLTLTGVDKAKLASYAARLREALQARGFTQVAVLGVEDSQAQVGGLYAASTPPQMVLVGIIVNDNGDVDLVIQVQPAAP